MVCVPPLEVMVAEIVSARRLTGNASVTKARRTAVNFMENVTPYAQ